MSSPAACLAAPIAARRADAESHRQRATPAATVPAVASAAPHDATEPVGGGWALSLKVQASVTIETITLAWDTGSRYWSGRWRESWAERAASTTAGRFGPRSGAKIAAAGRAAIATGRSWLASSDQPRFQRLELLAC
jgi:hypothetical protein